MSGQRAENSIESSSKDASKEQDNAPEASPGTKLERRRRIEDLFEEKRLREELGEFDLM